MGDPPRILHDVFLAHATPDASVADGLHALIAPFYRVFLARRDLFPGDAWYELIPPAQHASRATVVVVSRHADGSPFVRDEIRTAIELSRERGDAHRVLPIWVDGAPAADAPYGLAAFQGFVLGGAVDLPAVVRGLRDRLPEVGPRLRPLDWSDLDALDEALTASFPDDICARRFVDALGTALPGPWPPLAPLCAGRWLPLLHVALQQSPARLGDLVRIALRLVPGHPAWTPYLDPIAPSAPIAVPGTASPCPSPSS